MIADIEFRLPDTAIVRDDRFDAVQFKASHNSYEAHVLVETQLRRHDGDANRFGCRGLEFDLHERQGGFPWSVKHISSGPDQDLSDFLRLLASWSRDRPNHDVITVTLDLKHVEGDPPDFPDRFDSLVRQIFDAELLVKPSDVISGAEILWPTLREMAGKFLFCFSGKEKYKAEYARRNGRLCFADISVSYGSILKRRNPSSDPRIFLNFDGKHWTRLRERLDRGPVEAIPLRVNPGYILRIFGLSSPQAWQFAERRGFNVLSTDSLTAKWSRLQTATPFRRLTS